MISLLHLCCKEFDETRKISIRAGGVKTIHKYGIGRINVELEGDLHIVSEGQGHVSWSFQGQATPLQDHLTYK